MKTRLQQAAILLALSALAACSGGSDEPAAGDGGSVVASGPPTAQTATVVGNTRLKFVPSTVQAKPGALALTMRIEGGVPHNLVFAEKAVGADIETLSSGSATGTYRFPAAGTYDFTCTLHPGMDGKVVVA